MTLDLIFSALLIMMWNLGMRASVIGIIVGMIFSFCLWEFYLENKMDQVFDRWMNK